MLPAPPPAGPWQPSVGFAAPPAAPPPRHSPPPSESGSDDAPKGDGKGKSGRPSENTVFVRGLSWHVTEEQFRRDFAECGEVLRYTMPRNERGDLKGIGFVTYATKEGFDTAIAYDKTE